MSISLAGNSQFDPLRFVDREYVAGVVPNAVPEASITAQPRPMCIVCLTSKIPGKINLTPPFRLARLVIPLEAGLL